MFHSILGRHTSMKNLHSKFSEPNRKPRKPTTIVHEQLEKPSSSLVVGYSALNKKNENQLLRSSSGSNGHSLLSTVLNKDTPALYYKDYIDTLSSQHAKNLPYELNDKWRNGESEITYEY